MHMGVGALCWVGSFMGEDFGKLRKARAYSNGTRRTSRDLGEGVERGVLIFGRSVWRSPVGRFYEARASRAPPAVAPALRFTVPRVGVFFGWYF